MQKSFALWIFWLANIPYSTATCGIRNQNGVGIRVAGGLPTHFGEWPHVCSILRFLEILNSTRFPFQLNAPGTLAYKTILGNQCWILSVWHHFWYNLFWSGPVIFCYCWTILLSKWGWWPWKTHFDQESNAVLTAAHCVRHFTLNPGRRWLLVGDDESAK